MTATETGADAQVPEAVVTPGLTPLARLKAILGGSAGNLVEWYDWFAYSSFALYFARHFFPEGDRTAQLLKASAVFAIGFLARPVGAWLMGLYADRAGRRTALTTAVAMMCLGAFAIAVLPDYSMIGAWAPAGLLIARLVQGLSVGGEYGASATYMTEMASRKSRGFWSSFQFVTLILGQLLALVVLISLQSLMSKADLEAWGWRIPFAIGGVLAIVVFWIRTGLEETASFTAAKAAGDKRARTMMLFLDHPKETAMIFGLTAGGSLAFYAYTTYMQKFLVNTAGFSKDVSAAISAGALVVYMCALPLFGWASDRLGRKATLAFTFGVGALATFPIFSAIAGTRDAMVAFLLVVSLLIILTGYSAVSAATKAELFPAHVRALGVALPYAAANAVFGGTAEFVALKFKQVGHESGFYIYVSAIMAVALAISLALPDSRRESRILED
ncbi:MFS transporter [Phenylobacterium sp.]|uniref:MFS transporter n=1 Tax=Phenylobacterium sp. TaxID=1871053 RepID=UPI0035ADDD25